MFNCTKAFGIHTSVSIGLTYSEMHDSFEEIFSRADQTLYEAKRTGKAKTVVYGEVIPPIQDDNKPVVMVCTKDVQLFSSIELT